MLSGLGAVVLGITEAVKRTLKLKGFAIVAASLVLGAMVSLLAWYGRIALMLGDPPQDAIEALARGLLAGLLAVGGHQVVKQAGERKGTP
jgi:hypothetical protein